MNRNEYRRAFIMLRAVLQGFGGHVRLERRTLTGSLYFIVTAPQGVENLRAALVGRRNGEYFAVPVGNLVRDRRGQLALAWSFDPRDIQGRPLEAYSWVTVATTGGPCAVALTGNVEGSRDVDPAALSRAVCALFSRQTSGDSALTAVPTGTEASPEPVLDDTAFLTWQTRFEPEQRQTDVAAETTPNGGLDGTGNTRLEPERRQPDVAAEDDDRCDIRIYTSSRSRRRRVGEQNVDSPELIQPSDPMANAQSEEATAAQARPTGTGRPSEGSADSHATPTDVGQTPEGSADPHIRPDTAAQRLGLDITSPWPETYEPLRRPFATQAPLETPLGDGFVYISAPMPQGSGLPAGFVGLKAEGGRITALRHALPGRRAPEPPAGLEQYRWVGAVGEDGYWVWDGDES